MNRSGMGKQLNGGMNPKKARREQPANSVPKANVQGSGASKNGNSMAKNVMGHGERCATAGGHLMGRGG